MRTLTLNQCLFKVKVKQWEHFPDHVFLFISLQHFVELDDVIVLRGVEEMVASGEDFREDTPDVHSLTEFGMLGLKAFRRDIRYTVPRCK